VSPLATRIATSRSRLVRSNDSSSGDRSGAAYVGGVGFSSEKAYSMACFIDIASPSAHIASHIALFSWERAVAW
jgi:hypothetical protein